MKTSVTDHCWLHAWDQCGHPEDEKQWVANHCLLHVWDWCGLRVEGRKTEKLHWETLLTTCLRQIWTHRERMQATNIRQLRPLGYILEIVSTSRGRKSIQSQTTLTTHSRLLSTSRGRKTTASVSNHCWLHIRLYVDFCRHLGEERDLQSLTTVGYILETFVDI